MLQMRDFFNNRKEHSIQTLTPVHAFVESCLLCQAHMLHSYEETLQICL